MLKFTVYVESIDLDDVEEFEIDDEGYALVDGVLYWYDADGTEYVQDEDGEWVETGEVIEFDEEEEEEETEEETSDE
jgi:hypothetical protein